MNPLSAILGVLLLFSVTVDLLWTTIWVAGGAGPLTSRMMSWIWTTLRLVSQRNSRLLTLAGPLILVTGLLLWIVLLWLGWSFLFASSEDVLIDTLNRGPISWSDRLYFTGYTIFTMGNGDFAPRGPVWQLFTTLSTASGMLFVTLSVTYVLSVLGAVTQKRSFADGLTGLGTSSTEVLLTSWTGEEFEGLDQPLNRFATQLNTLTSNHKAYPILHYFHSESAAKSPVVGIVVLDETLTVLTVGVSDREQPTEIALQNARSSVDSYLEMMEGAFVTAAEQPPPHPARSRLRAAGIPTVSETEFHTAVSEADDRRRLLRGIVESENRRWPASDES